MKTKKFLFSIFAAVVLMITVSCTNHTHDFTAEWKSDDENHWHECECLEKSDISAHEWGEAQITKQPSCNEEGSKKFECAVCGKEKVEVVSKLQHSFTQYEYNNDATLEQDGTETALCDYGCGTSNTRNKEGSKVLQPTFSQESYVYDKYVGGVMEMPLELYGFNIYYVELNGNIVHFSNYSYNEETSCFEFSEDYILSLLNGEYVVTIITDADAPAEAVTAKITINNTIITSFDPVTVKEFVLGKQESVEFNVDFNTATVKSLVSGDRVLDASTYSLDGNVLSIYDSAVDNYYGDVNFTITLSNNDKYDFTLKTNTKFFTDYDVTTIHDDYISTVGHNPLYQYSDGESVTIVEAPVDSGMSGNVLKYIPNTVDTLYDCQNVYTLKSDSCSYSWYNVGYQSGLYYQISFDYYLENTAYEGANFSFKVEDGSKVFILNSGQNNKLHHFSVILPGSVIKFGTCVRAYFPTQGGLVYFDNFKVVELTDVPSIMSVDNYQQGTSDLVVDYVPNGYIIDKVMINDAVVDAVINDSQIIIAKEIMEKLPAGNTVLKLCTPVGELTAEFNVVEPAVVELTETNINYVLGVTKDVKLSGSFGEGLSIVSVKRNSYTYDSYFGANDWNFVKTDFSRDYSDQKYIELVCGLDNQGYLLVKEELLMTVEKEQSFTVSYSNGATTVFTVSSNSVMLNNYDDSYLYGVFRGADAAGSPLSSGFNGSALSAVKEREEGNKALYILQTSGSADPVAYTIKFHQHVWDWYRVVVNEDGLYRITFTYQLSGLDNTTNVKFIVGNGTDVSSQFYGSGYVVDTTPNDWDEVQFYLNNDGQVHTFDSGWFKYSDPLLLKIQLPMFVAGDDTYFMIDDFRIEEIENPLEGEYSFTVDSEEELVLDLGVYSPVSVKIDDLVVDSSVVDNKIYISCDSVLDYSLGKHTLVVETNEAVFKSIVILKRDAIANLNVNRANYKYGQESLLLDGEFAKVSVLSATRKGTNEFDTALNTPVSISVEYFNLLENGLEISNELLDMIYGETTFTLSLSNGDVLEVVINSSVKYSTNWDEVYVQQPMDSYNNAYNSQDYTSISFVEGIDGTSLKYYTKQATGLAASGVDNGIMVFGMPWATISWANSYTRASFLDNAKSYRLTFDYQIVGEGIDYYFKNVNSFYEASSIVLDPSKNTFEYFIPAYTDFQLIQIASSVAGGLEGCYMLIDNYRFEEVDEVLIDYTADYTYSNVAITSDLTVTSVTKQGTYQYDLSHIVPVSVSNNYVNVIDGGLVFAKELLNDLYGSTCVKVTVSNGCEYSLVLKSNKIFQLNWDGCNVDQYDTLGHAGNIAMHQDTSMVTYTDSGINGRSLVYTPANATLGHSSYAGTNDNSIITTEILAESSFTNGFWYQIPAGDDDTLKFTFKYLITTTDTCPAPTYQFSYRTNDGTGTWVNVVLTTYDEVAEFSITVKRSELSAFKMNCYWTDSVSTIVGTSLMIDDFVVETVNE